MTSAIIDWNNWRKKILTKFSEVNVTKSQEMLDQFDKSIESYIKMSYCESTDSRNIT